MFRARIGEWSNRANSGHYDAGNGINWLAEPTALRRQQVAATEPHNSQPAVPAVQPPTPDDSFPD